MKIFFKPISFILIITLLTASNCDPSYSIYIKNNTQDTLFVILHYNKKILDYSNIDYFDDRFSMICPNDSVIAGQPVFGDQFLIIVYPDTLRKYETFENVVELNKFNEFIVPERFILTNLIDEKLMSKSYQIEITNEILIKAKLMGKKIK
jgi:hypothetical protein